MGEPRIKTVEVGECRLRTATWGAGAPRIVLLHDGLGSLGQWRSVPSEVAQATGATVLVYERAGHGASEPIPSGPWPADWLHHEATVLTELLDVVGADRPILVGHSDGGSTALIHASLPEANAGAVLAIAPHSWVEQVCFESIVAMRANRGPIEIGLARHHNAPQELFAAWSGVWVSDTFREWDIRPQLASIEVPVVIAQGAADAYASDDQAHLTAAAIGSNAQSLIVPDVGHIMHHDDAAVVVELIVQFAHDNP